MSNLVDEHNKRLDERLISTYDTKILEGKLDLGNEKFDPNGTARPFYGLTCIAWLDQESELFQTLCELQIMFEEKFQAVGLGHIFAFLEPKSFHMTVCDINASSIPDRCFDERIIEIIRNAFDRIKIQGYQLKPRQHRQPKDREQCAVEICVGEAKPSFDRAANRTNPGIVPHIGALPGCYRRCAWCRNCE